MIVDNNLKVPFKPKRQFIDKLVNPEWSATAYGNQKWIRRMGFFPRFLPLCIKTDHAPGIPSKTGNEIYTSAPFILFHSQEHANFIKTLINPKKVKTFCSPFVFYLSRNKIKEADRNGSLYFYAHGNNEIKPLKPILEVIEDIKNLPLEFHPVTICLHYQDLINKTHLHFLNQNYKVICMGNPNDWNFIENYYENLNKFKYTLSSNFSSYSLYSINFGIPFSLIGNESKFLNHANNHIPIGEYTTTDINSNYYKQIKKLFTNLSYFVDSEQKKFVDQYLGVDNLNRLELFTILYFSFIKCLFNLKFWKKYLFFLKSNI
jgi:hypothetical protein